MNKKILINPSLLFIVICLLVVPIKVKAEAPSITTTQTIITTGTTVTLNGSITNIGIDNVTEHGFAYGTSTNLSTVIATTTLGAKVGTGSFTNTVSDLTPNTTYYVRAYGTNTDGTGYGGIQSFIINGISTCTQLQAMNNNLAADYILLNNIDCTGFDPNSDGKGFIPIGNESNPFTGSFNGNNYTISNLNINRPDEDYVGLFGYVHGKTFKNVTITGSISGQYSVGSLVGYSTTNGLIINNATSSVTITGDTSNVGGLVGNVDSVTGNVITNSHYTGNITITSTNQIYYIGGIIGATESSEISSSSFRGNITITSTNLVYEIGGITGSSYQGNITNSYVSGNIIISANNHIEKIGGLVGYSEEGSVSKSYMSGNLTATTTTQITNGIGGLVGYIMGGDISNSYVSGNMNLMAANNLYHVGGLLGYGDLVSTNNFFSGNIYATSTSAKVSGIGGVSGYSNGGSTEIINNYSTGKIVISAGDNAENVGGIIGYTNTSENIENSFAATVISIISTNPSIQTGAMIGFNIINTLINNFYDKTTSTQALCWGSYTSDPLGMCTAIENNTAYFKGNNTNPPLSSWNFSTIWSVVADQYPILTNLPSPYPPISIPAPAPIVVTPIVVAQVGPIGGSSPQIPIPQVQVLPILPVLPVFTPRRSLATTSFLPTRTLQINTKNADVINLQKFLNSQGFLVTKKGLGSPGKETMFFGSATKVAVTNFQKAHKIIPANGVVGPKTRAKINELLIKTQKL